MVLSEYVSLIGLPNLIALDLSMSGTEGASAVAVQCCPGIRLGALAVAVKKTLLVFPPRFLTGDRKGGRLVRAADAPGGKMS